MATREDVSFRSGADRISAWLYRPEESDPDGAPLLVMAHGLGAVRTMRLDAYAERFAAAGYACLLFDYRNFGDSDGAPHRPTGPPRSTSRTPWPVSTATGSACGARRSAVVT